MVQAPHPPPTGGGGSTHDPGGGAPTPATYMLAFSKVNSWRLDLRLFHVLHLLNVCP